MGYPDLHPGMDCVADWVGSQALCMAMYDTFSPKGKTTRGMIVTILSGSGNKLDPKGDGIRAEAAAMLMRFCEEENR